MNNFLAKLKPDTKTNIGISISPNVGLEMVVIDPVQHKIMKYAHRALSYNPSTREIEDYVEFKKALEDLYHELRLQPQNTNVVVNFPSVCFGHMFLTTALDEEGTTGAVLSKVEEDFIFKKNEPVVSWLEVKENNTTEKRYILYSAIQGEVVNIIKQTFSGMGATLIAVENTYSSLMKTLEYTELTKDFAKTAGSWNILLVSQNSYAVFSLIDYNIIEYYEDPLAIKSFSEDEAYVAISQAASSVLAKYPSDKLLVISESNDVSAEILAMQLKQPGEVIFLECNQYAKTPIMDVDLNVLPAYIKAITPEVIGAGIYRSRDFSLKLNFLLSTDYRAPDTVTVMGFDLTKEQLMIYTLIIGGAIAGICFLCSIALGTYIGQLESKRASLEEESTAQAAELATLQQSKGTIDIYSAAKTIDKSMLDKILYYNAIGADIPSKVWLTTFYADSSGAYGIKGETTSVDDVYLFFRNIKAQVPQSDLILSKLSVDDKEGLIDIEKTTNANYTFELTNGAYGSAPSASSAAPPADPNAPPPDPNVPATNSSAPNGPDTLNVPKIPDLPGM